MLASGIVKSASLREEHRNDAGKISGPDFSEPVEMRFLKYLQKVNFVKLYGWMGCGKVLLVWSYIYWVPKSPAP